MYQDFFMSLFMIKCANFKLKFVIVRNKKAAFPVAGITVSAIL